MGRAGAPLGKKEFLFLNFFFSSKLLFLHFSRLFFLIFSSFSLTLFNSLFLHFLSFR